MVLHLYFIYKKEHDIKILLIKESFWEENKLYMLFRLRHILYILCAYVNKVAGLSVFYKLNASAENKEKRPKFYESCHKLLTKPWNMKSKLEQTC